MTIKQVHLDNKALCRGPLPTFSVKLFRTNAHSPPEPTRNSGMKQLKVSSTTSSRTNKAPKSQERRRVESIHDFLRFQIKEHMTGDPLEVDLAG
jgi:hypothetical protein